MGVILCFLVFHFADNEEKSHFLPPPTRAVDIPEPQGLRHPTPLEYKNCSYFSLISLHHLQAHNWQRKDP